VDVLLATFFLLRLEAMLSLFVLSEKCCNVESATAAADEAAVAAAAVHRGHFTCLSHLTHKQN